MGINKGYRSTNIDKVTFDEEGNIEMIQGTLTGVEQFGALNPYQKVEAVTMGVMGGIETTQYGEKSIECGSGDMIVTGIHTGSWIGVYGVDFGTRHVEEFSVAARGKGTGYIKICMDSLDGEVLGYAEIDPDDAMEFTEITTQIDRKIAGKHDIYFIFSGKGFELESWYFN